MSGVKGISTTGVSPVTTEKSAIGKVAGDPRYGRPEKPAADGYVQESGKFKESNISRAKFSRYLEACAAKEGRKARENAPPKVKGPLEDNCRMFKELGYSETECDIMCLQVVRKLEKFGFC